MTIIAYNLIIKNNNELKNLSRTNDRIGHLHIEWENQLDEWVSEMIPWYNGGTGTEGSGFSWVDGLIYMLNYSLLEYSLVGIKYHQTS